MIHATDLSLAAASALRRRSTSGLRVMVMRGFFVVFLGARAFARAIALDIARPEAACAPRSITVIFRESYASGRDSCKAVFAR